MLLTFLIPTINGREAQFNALCDEIIRQAKECSYSRKITIAYSKDDKEASIGIKRHSLAQQCKSKYCVMIDDDDMITPWYLDNVVRILKEEQPDCITYREAIVMGGHPNRIVNHSNKYDKWRDNVDGFAHVRTPFYKDIIKTSIVKEIGFKDMRYGEDKDFSDRLKASGLIKTEHHIDEVMYIYNAPSSLTHLEHNKRYGIK